MARYIERAPLSLEKLSIHDEIVTYTTKDGEAHEFDALEFLAELSCHIPKTNAEGIADFRAPPPIPTYIDTSEALDEIPSYDAFEPPPDDL